MTNEQIKHQEELKANRDKLTIRKARTRRLIQHGAIVESFIIGSENMDPETFKNTLEQLISPTGRRTPSEPERMTGMQVPKEMRTSPNTEVTLSEYLIFALSQEGFSEDDIIRLKGWININLSRFEDNKTFKLPSKRYKDRFILICRVGNQIEVA